MKLSLISLSIKHKHYMVLLFNMVLDRTRFSDLIDHNESPPQATTSNLHLSVFLFNTVVDGLEQPPSTIFVIDLTT